MNLQQQVNFMESLEAAANPFPLKASFHQSKDGLECKLCGDKMSTQGAAVDHLLRKHRQMAAADKHGHMCTCQACIGKKMPANKLKADGMNSKEMEARDFSEGRRKKLAKSGKAMPGGGFPIVNKKDLANARQAIGRAKNPAAARSHIRERAKALGVKLPSKWKASGTSEGVKKAWDTRGRGRKLSDDLRDHLVGAASEAYNNLYADLGEKAIDKMSEKNLLDVVADSMMNHIDTGRISVKQVGQIPDKEIRSIAREAIYGAPLKKRVTAEQFSPADRLQMPPKAGTTQRTVAPVGMHIQASTIRQRPGGPKKKVGSLLRGSQIV